MEKLFQVSTVLALTAAILFIYMSLWAFYAIIKKRADSADLAWGLGFVVVSWFSWVLSGFSLYGLVVNLLVTLWGLRLAFHIYRRNRNRSEDFRYEKLKSSWGKRVNLRIFFQVFLLQGLLLYVVALPILWIQTHPLETSWMLFAIALPFWIVGFLVEAISDHQLFLFQKERQNKGKLLMTGVWKYSRHPNYLGEIIQWFALWMIAAPLPFGAWFVLSPLLLTFLIVKVSGIAPLEAKMKEHPDFKAYAENTPSLLFSFLRPRKKGSGDE